MNGGDFAGVSYGDSFQQHHNQQHRIRSMSWCDGPEITTTTNQMGEMPPIHLAQEEVTLSPDPSLGKNEVELPSCSTEVINLKKPSARKNAWGCLSYADLIAKAIESSPNQRLTLNQIYSWMVENVPYFRAKGHTNSSAGWKNSIRHNLSLHGRFVRVQNEGAGKSSWWMVNNNNRLQKTPRRRSSTLDSKSLDKKRKTSHHHPNSTHDSNDPLNNSNSCLSSFYKSPCHLQQQLPFHFQYPQQQQRVQKLDSFETAFRSLDRSAFNNNNNNANNLNNNHNYNPLNKNLTKNLSMFDNFNQYNSNNIFNISTSCFRPQQQPQHCLFNDITSSTHESQELILNTNSKMSFNNFHDNDPKTSIHFNHNPSQIHLFHPLPHNTNKNNNQMDIFSMPEEAWRTYLPPSPDQLTETVISSESLTAFLESGADSEMVDLVPPPFISINNLTQVSLSNSNLHNIDNNRNGEKSTYNNILSRTSDIINDISRNNNNSVSHASTTFKNDVFRGMDCINTNDFNNDNVPFDYNELRDNYIINLTTNYNNKSVLNNTNNKGVSKLFNFKIVPNNNNNKQNENSLENNANETPNSFKEDGGDMAGLNADDNYEKPLLYNILQNNNPANNFNKTFNNNNNNNNNDVLTPCSRDDFYPKIVELLSSGSDVNNNNIKTENNNSKNNVENNAESNKDEAKAGTITSSTDPQLLPCDSQDNLFDTAFDPSPPHQLHQTSGDDLSHDGGSFTHPPDTDVCDAKGEQSDEGSNKNVSFKATKKGTKNKKEV